MIRKAFEKDIEDLRRLIAEFYVDNKKTYSKILQGFEEYKDNKKVVEEKVNKYLSDKKYLLFVAEEDGMLFGYICGLIIHKPPYKKLNKEGYIQDWFVSIRYRRNKIGMELFSKLLEEFRNEGCTHVAFDTFAENKDSIAIYEKLGFYKRLISFVKKI